MHRNLKFLTLLVALSVLLTFTLVGCGEKAEESKESQDDASKSQEADVIVIGVGGAGMGAALADAEEGVGVIILEKMPFAGGNTIRSKVGKNATGTEAQKKLE